MTSVGVAAEQRKRIRVDLEVEVTCESEHNFYTGLSENISEGGLFVATSELLPVGSRLQVRFTLPEAAPVEAAVEVRWLRDRAAPDLPTGMGLHFLDLDRDAARVIGAFVKGRETIFFED